MTCYVDLADYEWLTGEEAAAVLVELAAGETPLHRTAERLRRRFSAARCHLALEQADLRRRARVKFSRPDTMFFTRLGLEQATDQWIAAYKACRFTSQRVVAELGCGIGGDLMGFAAVTSVCGIDRDPIAAHLAAANLRGCKTDGRSQVTCSDIADFDLHDVSAWHADPDRRPAGMRTTALDWSSPGSELIERLLADSPHAAVKLAPAADFPAHWNRTAELEWISRDRQCRQLVAWHGALAEHPGQRRATLLAANGAVLADVRGIANAAVTYAEGLGRYLYEPDAAVLAAHLGGALAAEHGLFALSPGIAYFTGDVLISDPALAAFEVEEQLALDVRLIGDYLRSRQIGRLEVKKRGVDHDPERIRKHLRLRGTAAATLFLTKLGDNHVAIVGQRRAAASA